MQTRRYHCLINHTQSQWQPAPVSCWKAHAAQDTVSLLSENGKHHSSHWRSRANHPVTIHTDLRNFFRDAHATPRYRTMSFIRATYVLYTPEKKSQDAVNKLKKLSSCNVNFCNGTQLYCCVNIYRYACNVSLVEECKMIFVHNMNEEYRAPFEKINFTFICPPPIYLTQNYLYHLRSRFMPNNYRTNIFSVTLISREIFHRPQLNGTPRT